MVDISEIIELSATPVRSHQAYRYSIVWGLLIIILSVLGARSFYLQVLKGPSFRSTAEGNRVAARLLTAPRGIIYDVRGEQLVENVASTDAVIDPSRLPNEDNESILVEQLPTIIPALTATAVRDALHQARRSERPVRLATALDHDTVLAIERQQRELPGVSLTSSLVRRYRDGRVTAPFLGYTGYVTTEDLEKHAYLASTDIIGKTGIERDYDEQLHGRHGVSYEEINAAGILQKQVRQEDPHPGADLHLSLDIEFQQFILETLIHTDEERQKEGQPLQGAAVVALDPRTGQIRALASYPSYDANIFSQPKLADQTEAALQDSRQLLFNRAVTGMYPPGSTIKPFIASAALNEGLITSETTFLSTGGLSVGPWNFPDWKAGGHGVTDVKKALAESVNTFFYLITGGNESQPGLGLARTRQYLAEFGFGELTVVDVPQEAPGFLPTESWKLKEKGEPWYIGDTYHLGIGQGDILITPLQLAVATAAIANGGSLHQPRTVRAIQHAEEEAEPVVSETRRVNVTADNLKVVQEGMRQVVTEGSARSLLNLPVALAGKTGTAQVGGGDDTHAWFTSWGPYESPELVITVLLERGGGGDTDAVPVARQLWQWWAEKRLAQPQ